MSLLESALRKLCAELASARIRFALVGGLAVSVRIEPRFTRDADLAIAIPTDAQAETLVHDLQQSGYTIGAIIEQDAVGRLATVRLQPPGESSAGVVLYLLFASSGIETEVVNDAETLEVLRDLTVPVATTAHLIALKVLSRDDRSRPQDLVDLRALLTRASGDDIERARSALKLIKARGFDRGKALLEDLDVLVRESPID